MVKILLTEEQIKNRVKELALEIEKDFPDNNLYIIGLMNGSFMFVSDLIRELKKNVCVDFIKIKSYNHENKQGDIKLLSDLNEMDLTLKNVLIVDDILDTGKTLAFATALIAFKNPKIIKTCVLLDKPSRRQINFKADYVGFTIDDHFVYGYGLDSCCGYNRNLKDIVYKDDQES